MKTFLPRTFAAAFAVTAVSLLGCSSGSGSSPPGAGSAGSSGGAVTSSGGTSAGGAGGVSTTAISSGGTTSNGGTPASGGQTQTQSSSIVQGGSATGGIVTSAAGQTPTGGSVAGGRTTGGAAGGESATGGSVAGGSAAGGSVAGSSATGGSATGGTSAGGTTTGGTSAGGASGGRISTGGATTGGRTATGGAGTTGTTGGAATGGRTTTGGSAAGGTATGGTTAPPIGGSLGSSDGTTPIKVWMAGDSTMAGGPTTACAACPCGYGSQLDPLFNSNVTVVNNAVGGLTIQTWLYQAVSSTPDANGECAVTNTAFTSRWTNMLNATTGMKAGDYLFISFGINDGDSSCPKHVGQTKYLGYLNLMVQAAKGMGVEPILMPPVGAIDCGGGSTAVNIRTPYFTTATNDAGAANNVPVIDLGKLSVDLYNSLGLCPNSADYTSTTSKVGQFFCQDHTHFELAGAKQIAQIIAKALKDQGIGLGAYVLN
jgi:lysophospholipase L1-like esterase